ncbi:MAG: DUF4275 family protein [Ruminococcus sp.]|nr:DUF4275 family protein [Ruminococcus sp.]
MNNRELISKWLEVFGKDVDENLIRTRVIAKGNYLWHIFTWGNVICLEGDDARQAFNDLQYTEAIKFCDGYSNHIKGVCEVEKTTANDVDEDSNSDVYIVAKDFSWTYVRTHESACGPYLCIKK